MEKYLGSFADKDDVESQFGLSKGTLKKIKIIVACYNTGDYEGSAFVLFKQGRKYFEVNASHCSCYGLEEQWSPEETSLKAIRHRVKEGNLDYCMEGYGNDVLAAMSEL